MTTFREYDISDHLRSKEEIEDFIDDSFAEAADLDDDQEAADLMLAVLGEAASAERKMSDIAHRADVGRTSLYHSLRRNANPSFRTILSAIRELGLDLRTTPRKAVA
ncbi:putative addiction module antidote protein [Bifidobacterium sp. ESL0763]|uniref:addiction module antidote protein n=1 Tax=Bifidobacterium sp. ESL0763 TaxID=2983227 RepID=UPI0023F76763|nr:addiction module antidote protein [Bifidobacterium sp. ESL0763]MDF7664044.1 putative addiction module antidote protein [Bifidobacterium sp. ESL0763]